MSDLSIKHLLGIRGMTRDDIETIFSTAAEFKEVLNRPIKKVPSLRDTTVQIYFLKILLELDFHLNLHRKGCQQM